MSVIAAFMIGIIMGYGICHFGPTRIWTWLLAAAAAGVAFFEQAKAFIGGMF